MKIGDKVKHKDQNIWGTIIEIGWSGNTVIILDETLEPDDNRLEFRKSDLKEIKE